LGWAGKYVSDHYPLFIHNGLLIAFFGTFFAIIIFCFLTRRFIIAAALFLVFSLGCVFRIHPLYVGLGPVYNSKLTQAIGAVSKPSDTWVVLDDILFENFPAMSNRNSLSGVQLYPNLASWRQVEGPKADFIYNRYAHVTFSSDPALKDKLQLVQFDRFQAQFSCDAFIRQHVQYALSTHTVSNSCVKQVDEVHYPALTFYLYRVY
jgi:hypothetical protein